MSSDKFTIKKAFQLTAIDLSGDRVYYDIDAHSGGYPFWGVQHNDRTYETLDKVPVIGPNDYMRKKVTRIEILEIEIQARVISVVDLIEDARARAMAEIDKIQKELETKVAALRQFNLPQ